MDATLTFDKPILPPKSYEKSFWGSAAFVGYAVTMWLAPLGIAWEVYRGPLDIEIQAALMIPLLILSGQGLHLLGWVGHEGFHFNLAKNQHVSAGLAVLLTGPVGFFSTVGENSIHWRHHRYTNREGDPQTVIFPKYKVFLTRLLFARVELEYRYLCNVSLLALNKLIVPMAFQQKTCVRYARLDLVWSTVWLIAYFWLTAIEPVAGLLFIVLPHLSAFTLSAIRPYAEHAGTEQGEFREARSLVSPLMSALYFFNNYHLEHHLYPTVPCWRLSRVHRYLKRTGIYERTQPHISARFTDWFRCAGKSFPYPSHSTQD
jgi:beta-carotene hydroxylase